MVARPLGWRIRFDLNKTACGTSTAPPAPWTPELSEGSTVSLLSFSEEPPSTPPGSPNEESSTWTSSTPTAA